MIIWQGWGILVPVVPVAIWFLVPEFFKAVMPYETYSNSFRYISGPSIFLGALALWFLGKKLNGANRRTLLDEETGEKVVLQSKHTLFFVKMEYWAIPVLLFSVVMTFL